MRHQIQAFTLLSICIVAVSASDEVQPKIFPKGNRLNRTSAKAKNRRLKKSDKSGKRSKWWETSPSEDVVIGGKWGDLWAQKNDDDTNDNNWNGNQWSLNWNNPSDGNSGDDWSSGSGSNWNGGNWNGGSSSGGNWNGGSSSGGSSNGGSTGGEPDIENTTSDTLTAAMGIYPGPATAAAPGGILQVSFESDGTLKIFMDTIGMFPNCSTSNTQTNGCGFHIHQGTVCNNDVLIAGHYWQPSSQPDPWANVRFNSDSVGRTKMIIYLPGGNGYDYQGNYGHAVVIHRDDGQRIACGILY